jgi:hypothetical protein
LDDIFTITDNINVTHPIIINNTDSGVNDIDISESFVVTIPFIVTDIL